MDVLAGKTRRFPAGYLPARLQHWDGERHGHQIVKEHADGGQRLLDRRLGPRVVFDISGNNNRLDFVKLDVMGLTPLEKLRHGSAISCPGQLTSIPATPVP